MRFGIQGVFQLDHDIDKSLDTIVTELDGDEIKSRLLKMSKRGKLPGYESDPADGLAAMAAHGVPFDSRLILHHHDGQVSFEPKLINMMPRFFVVLLIVSIWPGLPLTQAFMNTFQWYERFEASTGIKMWYWYLPLTVLPAPFMWKSAIAKSKASAIESSQETIEKITKVLS